MKDNDVTMDVSLEHETVKKLKEKKLFEEDNKTLKREFTDKLFNRVLADEYKYFSLLLSGYKYQKRELTNVIARQVAEETGKPYTFAEMDKFFPEWIINKFDSEENVISDVSDASLSYSLICLRRAVVIEIDEKFAHYLGSVDNQLFIRELPFEFFFLDYDFVINGYTYKGLLVSKDKNDTHFNVLTFASLEKGEKNNCKEPLMFGMNIEGEYENYLEESLKYGTYAEIKKVNLKSVAKLSKVHNKNMKKLMVIICNFIDFINNPDIELIKFTRSEKNEERTLKKGGIPFPKVTMKIGINHKLRIFLDEFYSNARKFHLKNKFLIRGHYIRFWKKDKYKRLYSLLENDSLPRDYMVMDYPSINQHKIIQRFVHPFYKGEGMIIKKNYEIKK